jgi:hypothetical protein
MGASDNNNNKIYSKELRPRAVMSGCCARGPRMKKNGDTGLERRFHFSALGYFCAVRIVLALPRARLVLCWAMV